MLPLYLSIEGFYSYQTKQEVDFTQLTEAGLFGIFGSVGSGKSSILEAIGFALYGNTERMNAQDRRGYNMMNLKSSQATIVFDFLNYENRKFRFTAHWKRKKSNFEDTGTILRQAYEVINEELIPLESANAQKITNLSYDNFKRTIIIPQGQFREFLELTGKNRSDMMKEIFQLNKFDLSPKVATLQQENNRQLENLRGQLSGFEEVSTEILQEKQHQLSVEKENLDRIASELEKVTLAFDTIKAAKTRHEALEKKQTELHELEEISPKIEQQEKDLQQYLQTVSLFRDPLLQQQKLSTEKDNLTLKVERLTDRRRILSDEIKKINDQLAKTEIDYKKLDQYRQEALDLQTLADFVKNKTELSISEGRLAKGIPIIEQTKRELDNVQREIDELESKIAELQNTRVDTSVMMNIEAWYLTQENHNKRIQQLQSNLQETQSTLESIRQQVEQSGYSKDHWEESLRKEEEQLEEQMQQLRTEETHLNVQVKLGEFAHQLVDGDPCPLCGALQHPHPMTTEAIGQEITHIKKQYEVLNAKSKHLKTVRETLTQLSSQRTYTEDLLQKVQLELDAAQLEVAEHRKHFIWPAYSPDDNAGFKIDVLKLQNNDKEIRVLEATRKTLREKWTSTADNITNYEQNIQRIKDAISISKALINKATEQIGILNTADYTNHSVEQLLQMRQEKQQFILEIERTYEKLKTELFERRSALVDATSNYQLSKDQFSALREELATLKNMLTDLLAENGHADLLEVQKILNKNIPTKEWEQEIQSFKIKLQVVEREVAQLLSLSREDNYSEELFQQYTLQYQDRKRAHEEQLSKKGALDSEYERLTVEFEKKQTLLAQLEKLQKRSDNLRILDNMFKGNGFVNYISTIHLERLCELANSRFHRLTKNQLSLTLNRNNEFDVIDFLNDGKSRSVKTLSGGQSFQASLCLALALAENIQSLNKADRNFFFIDEGFGTQDKESIATVFDTLQYLHKEHRVVGIISHVDELKEKIPRSITITKTETEGSVLGEVV